MPSADTWGIRAVQNEKSPCREVFAAVDAMKDEAAWQIVDDMVIIENPKFKEDNGENPFLVLHVSDLVYYTLMVDTANDEQQNMIDSTMKTIGILEARADKWEKKAKQYEEAILAANAVINREV